MTIQERRERERTEIRETILDAARELFAVYGYDGVSMRKIAEKIDYSPTTIYLYFADKEALIRELCYEDFGKLAAAMKDLIAIPDPVERLVQIGRAYVEFGVKYPNHYRLMFMTPEPVTAGEPPDGIKGNPETDTYELVRVSVAEAAKDGRLSGLASDVDLVAQTLWAAVHGVVALEITMRGDNWTPWRPLSERTEVMLEAVSRALFQGRI